MPRPSVYLFLFLAIIFQACRLGQAEQQPSQAFYLWQSKPEQPLASYADYLDSLATKKIYLRVFDMVWRGEAQVLAPLQEAALGHWPEHLQCIPTVYITHSVMQNCPDSGVQALARQLAQGIRAKLDALGSPPCQEWQIDCDWSPSIKERYFRFLELLDAEAGEGIELSATIRLHQMKYYQRTGVPPVARGVLMCYNMGDLGKIDEQNSIFHIPTLRKYLYNLDVYPLPFDIALPLFSWAIQFRSGRFVQILSGLGQEELSHTVRFRKLDLQSYQVLQSHYTEAGNYIYAGDIIRLEQVSEEELREGYALLRERLGGRRAELIWYDLQSGQRQRYAAETLLRARF